MVFRPSLAGAAVGGLLLAGCAAPDPAADLERTAALVTAATGAASLGLPGDEEAARQRVAALLADGLTAAEAAEVALLQHPGLQAALCRVGVGRAEAVQAGLLTNPSLGAVLRMPTGGGIPGVELGLVQVLADLWRIPARRRAAAAELERTVLEVARTAAAQAWAARQAWHRAAAAEAAVEVAAANVAAARELLELTRDRRAAGAGNEIDVNVARTDHLEQELILLERRRAAWTARADLVRVLGLDQDPAAVVLAEAATDTPPPLPDTDALLAQAAAARLDLRAAERLADAAAARVGLAHRGRIPEVALGIQAEREPRPAGAARETTLGPSLEVELPLFDRGGAGLSAAEWAAVAARRQVDAVALTVRQEVRAAREAARASQEIARFFDEQLLVREAESLDLAREAYRLGKTGFLSVLEAQRALLAARAEAIDARARAAVARVDLEAAVGRPLAEVAGDAPAEQRKETP